jgi:hypothetical protein
METALEAASADVRQALTDKFSEFSLMQDESLRTLGAIQREQRYQTDLSRRTLVEIRGRGRGVDYARLGRRVAWLAGLLCIDQLTSCASGGGGQRLLQAVLERGGVPVVSASHRRLR